MTQYKSIYGMHDLLPAETELWQFVEKLADKHFELYQFKEIRTPLLEQTTLFTRSLGETTGVVKKEMYTFEDKGGDSVTLRPEGTASVVRSFLEHKLINEDALHKLYYKGPMFRYERPQKGRLRQFHQLGCEIIGSASAFCDIEAIELLHSFITELKIKAYQIKINSLGCTTHEECRPKFLGDLKKYFQKNAESYCAECKNRMEVNPLRVLDCKNETCRKLNTGAPELIHQLCTECHAHFETVKTGLNQLHVPYTLDTRIVRGLDYYDKTAFEVVSENLGSQNAFAGGGRYNKLISSMGGPDVPAVGFAIGFERLILLLNREELGMPVHKKVFIACMGEATHLKALEITQGLRQRGVIAEMEFDQKSLKSQMRRANKIGAEWVIILGEREIETNQYTVKNLTSGEQTQHELAALLECFSTPH